MLHDSPHRDRVMASVCAFALGPLLEVKQGLDDLDEKDKTAICRLRDAFQAREIIVIGALGSARELYNATTLGDDVLQPRSLLIGCVRSLLDQRQKLQVSKLGLLFFRELDDPDAVRYLHGEIERLSEFAALNGGLEAVRFTVPHGRVQVDAYDPLLFDVRL
ncbi:MAG TPA: hypothetical protein VEA80_04660 [Vitreimonas sp.]|nr:hypothetical protein [Vitreimonas sp.]